MGRMLCIILLTPIALALLAPCDDLRLPGMGLGVSDDPKLDRLMAAIESRDGETFRRLLRDSAIDPNARDRDGYTPLIRAARVGWLPGIRSLLERGADANAADNFDDDTAIHFAVRIVVPDNSTIVALLLRHGANVNARGHGGIRPLMMAILTGRSELVPQLIRAGADPNAAADNGFTPLHYAAMMDDPQATKILLAAGADPAARDDEGRTPLDVARERGSLQAAQAGTAPDARHLSSRSK